MSSLAKGIGGEVCDTSISATRCSWRSVLIGEALVHNEGKELVTCADYQILMAI
jgi:hypothetical protein